MLFIKVNTIEDFNDINDRIHKNRMRTIDKYSAEKWADPIFSKDGLDILCPIYENDFSVLKDNEIPEEIKENNENYFPKIKFQ